jgi:hypothetical protein
VIDAGDLAPWRLRFGRANGAGSTALTQLAVPEPAALRVIIAATVALITMGRLQIGRV